MSGQPYALTPRTHWRGRWWAPAIVWTLWIREKSLTPTRIWTLHHPACSPVTLQTILLGTFWKVDIIYRIIWFSYIKEYSNWIFNELLQACKNMCTTVTGDHLYSKPLLGLSYYIISCHKKNLHILIFLGFWSNQI
jgi:hypothetical protein